jgi:hypothetical protein
MTAQVLQIKHTGITAFCLTYSLQGKLNSQTVTQSVYLLFIPILGTWLTEGHVYKES